MLVGCFIAVYSLCFELNCDPFFLFECRNENIGALLEDLCKSRLNEVRLLVK